MERLGFIGLGIMGAPMARNLLNAGYPLTVHSRSVSPVEALVREGATAAASPAQTARKSDVIITMLPDSSDVERVLVGPHGVVEGAKEGTLVIDMSTAAPATARLIHEILNARGVEFLDAPVSGGDIGARDGTLSIMVGGEEKAFQRALPVLKVLGTQVVHIGGPGAGQIAKACNQIVVALTMQGICEAFAMATRAGVDPAKVREALLGGFAYSRMLEVHGKRMIDGNFDPGFKLSLHRKDLGIAQQTGRDYSIPLLGTGQVAALMDALLARNLGERDHSILYTFWSD